MRSSQLDAARLDEELTAMLREQFMRAFALFRPGAVARMQPELTLLLDFLVGAAAGGLRPRPVCWAIVQGSRESS
jgi:hypothetical protein